MLYKDTCSILSQITQFLTKQGIDCPQPVASFIQSLEDCLRTGRGLSKEELSSIEPYLFPDAGMGWLNDVQYEIDKPLRSEFNELLNKLYVAWES